VIDLTKKFLTRFEDIIKNRLLDIAPQKKRPMHNPDYSKCIPKDSIAHDEEAGVFFVSSNSTDETNIVDPKLKICSCPDGRTGKFCKHVAGVEFHFQNKLQLPKIMTREDRYKLAILAGAEVSREFLA